MTTLTPQSRILRSTNKAYHGVITEKRIERPATLEYPACVSMRREGNRQREFGVINGTMDSS